MDYQVPKLQFDHAMREELHERAYQSWDRYYTRRCEQSDEEIARRWHRDLSSVEAYEASVAPNREHLLSLLGGWRWERGDLAAEGMVIDKCAAYTVSRIFITVLEDVRIDFLLLVPNGLTKPAPVANLLGQPFHGLQGFHRIVQPVFTCRKHLRSQAEAEQGGLRLDTSHIFGPDVDGFVENGERFQFGYGLECRVQIRFVALWVGRGHRHIDVQPQFLGGAERRQPL